MGNSIWGYRPIFDGLCCQNSHRRVKIIEFSVQLELDLMESDFFFFFPAGSPPSSQFTGRVRNDSISSLHDSVEAENIMTISGAHTTGSSFSVCDDSISTPTKSPKQQMVKIL